MSNIFFIFNILRKFNFLIRNLFSKQQGLSKNIFQKLSLFDASYDGMTTFNEIYVIH